MILDKVLSEERTAAYATTIQDINRDWSDCNECNWYKSKQYIMFGVRLYKPVLQLQAYAHAESEGTKDQNCSCFRFVLLLEICKSRACQ